MDALSGAALAHRTLQAGNAANLATASGLVPAKQRDDSTELELVLVERSRAARPSVATLPATLPTAPVTEAAAEEAAAAPQSAPREAKDEAKDSEDSAVV